jgi:hypothetical protein
MGGAEKVIVSLTELMVVGLLAPTLWGLFSKKVNSPAVWITAIITFAIGFLVRFGLNKDGFLDDISYLASLSEWIQAHGTETKTFTGVILPLFILSVIQLLSKKTSAGYARVQACQAAEEILEATSKIKASRLPAIIVAWSIGACGLLMSVLALLDKQSPMVTGIFAIVLFLLAGSIGLFVRFSSDKSA